MFRMMQTTERGRQISAMINAISLQFKRSDTPKLTGTSRTNSPNNGALIESASAGWRRRRRRRGLVGAGGPSIRSTWF